MTEANLSVSNKSWNPAKKEFWGTNPDTKLNVLFVIAIIGLILSIFANFIMQWWLMDMIDDRFPTFHALILLMAVKTEIRPSKTSRMVIGLLLGWSVFKTLFYLFSLIMNLKYTGFTISMVVGFMNPLLLSIITFSLWKKAKKKHYNFWRSGNQLLAVIFSVLIISWFNNHLPWYFDRDGLWAIIWILGPILFWFPFTLLYVYRIEVEPWKSGVRIPKKKNLESIDAYTANKLLEAKDLLDKGIISMEEFIEIKKETIGSEDEPTYVLPAPIASDDSSINSNYKEPKKRGSSMKMEELKELAKMKKEGLITDGEYKKMKKEIID